MRFAWEVMTVANRATSTASNPATGDPAARTSRAFTQLAMSQLMPSPASSVSSTNSCAPAIATRTGFAASPERITPLSNSISPSALTRQMTLPPPAQDCSPTSASKVANSPPSRTTSLPLA
jgi:hypothetical protein